MKKIFWYIVSIFLASISLFFMILYLNLLTLGYTFKDYVYFIIRRIECNCLLFALLILFLIKKKG